MAFHKVFYSGEKLHSGGNIIFYLSQLGEALENAVSHFACLPCTGSDPEGKGRCQLVLHCLGRPKAREESSESC